jgi:hypothetical protein
MADTLESVLIGGAAGLVSSVITYFSTRARIRLDLVAQYDKELQTNRLKMYQILWAALEPLARYGRGPVTYRTLVCVSNASRDWYFKQGVIAAASALRTSLSDDIGTKQLSRL